MTGLILSGIPELFLLSIAFIIGDGERFASVLAAAIIHELGHIIAARILGIRIRFFSSGMSGIALRYDFSVSPPIHEAIVCFAGPLFGVIVFLFGYIFSGIPYLAGASFVLSFFNLLPISHLDGGCITSSLLSLFLDADTVWRICRVLSFLFTALLWCAAVFMMLHTGADISVITVSVYLLYRLFSEV